MQARMVASQVRWCRYYGKRGREGDQERRMVKRSEKNKWRKDLRKAGS